MCCISHGEELTSCGTNVSLVVAHTNVADDHIGFGVKDNVNYLIIVDIHSKWLDVVSVKSATAGRPLMY